MRGLYPRFVLDRPRIEPLKQGGVPNRTQICFGTMLLSAHVNIDRVSRMRDLQKKYYWLLVVVYSKSWFFLVIMDIIFVPIIPVNG